MSLTAALDPEVEHLEKMYYLDVDPESGKVYLNLTFNSRSVGADDDENERYRVVVTNCNLFSRKFSNSDLSTVNDWQVMVVQSPLGSFKDTLINYVPDMIKPLYDEAQLLLKDLRAVDLTQLPKIPPALIGLRPYEYADAAKSLLNEFDTAEEWDEAGHSSDVIGHTYQQVKAYARKLKFLERPVKIEHIIEFSESLTDLGLVSSPRIKGARGLEEFDKFRSKHPNSRLLNNLKVDNVIVRSGERKSDSDVIYMIYDCLQMSQSEFQTFLDEGK